MNIVKKIITVVMILTTIIYFPIACQATEEMSIVEDAQEMIPYLTPEEITISERERAVVPFNYTFNHSKLIKVNRSSNGGITLNVTQTSGYTMQVCLFKSDKVTVIGPTYSVPNNSMQSISWTANEIGSNNTTVYIYIYDYI